MCSAISKRKIVPQSHLKDFVTPDMKKRKRPRQVQMTAPAKHQSSFCVATVKQEPVEDNADLSPYPEFEYVTVKQETMVEDNADLSPNPEFEYVTVKQETMEWEVPGDQDSTQDPLNICKEECSPSEDLPMCSTSNIEKQEDVEDEGETLTADDGGKLELPDDQDITQDPLNICKEECSPSEDLPMCSASYIEKQEDVEDEEKILSAYDGQRQTVRTKNWKGCVATLAKRGSGHLDTREMLVPAGRAEDWWPVFCATMGRVACLQALELCRCPAAAVEQVAQHCPQLAKLSALSITDQIIDLSTIGQLKNLQKLRLRNLSGMYLSGNFDGFKELTNLKHLSLTMVKNLGRTGCGVLGCLQSLETLELGECCDLPEAFGGETLPQLTSLRRLRLEKGQGEALLAGVRALPALATLELVNFDVKPGFDTALARCQNVRHLLIIPTYVSQSATTNQMVLGGVTKLGSSLTHFVWGVTYELLRVTELFVDQCEDQEGPPGSHTGKEKDKKKSHTPPIPGAGAGDSIPVLRPVPGSIPAEDSGNKSADSGTQGKGSSPTSNSTPGPPQVDILPLTKLQKMLATALPNTKIKILKVAFQATWRQYISETDF